jgi:hypothetical protein
LIFIQGAKMRKTTLLFVMLVLALPFLLAACGGDKTGNAEKFLKALDEGDVDEAQKYVCDDEKDSLDDMGEFLDSVSISDISCEEDGDNVKCTYKATVEGSDPQEVTETYKMDGDKLCGTVQ